ncbi:hypothetical protein AGMMS50262_05940 [Bacteroidia bacterium]|nr:hypothetical protein AGMMS50262_05940 [Bacteroidia bacterium]
MFPQPFPEVELIFSIPFIRLNIASKREVASISTTRDAFPGKLNEMLIWGSDREGESLTGNKGISANPISDRQTNITIIENEDFIEQTKDN